MGRARSTFHFLVTTVTMVTIIIPNSLAHFPSSPFFPCHVLQTCNPVTHRFPLFIMFLPFLFYPLFHQISSFSCILFPYFRYCTFSVSQLFCFIQSILKALYYSYLKQGSNHNYPRVNHVLIGLIPVPVRYIDTHTYACMYCNNTVRASQPVTATTHRKIKIETLNVCNSFELTVRCVLPVIIKIVPPDRGRPTGFLSHEMVGYILN
jgi:hypothetical protein